MKWTSDGIRGWWETQAWNPVNSFQSTVFVTISKVCYWLPVCWAALLCIQAPTPLFMGKCRLTVGSEREPVLSPWFCYISQLFGSLSWSHLKSPFTGVAGLIPYRVPVPRPSLLESASLVHTGYRWGAPRAFHSPVYSNVSTLVLGFLLRLHTVNCW